VHRQLFVLHELVGKFRNELFGELMGTVDIVASSNQTGKFETAKVTLDQEFRTSLGGRIGIGRFQDVLFRHGVGFKVCTLSINFIRRNMHKSLNRFAALGTLQENVSTIDIRVGKGKGVSKGVIDVSLCSKMHNGVDFLFSQDVGNEVGRSNVSFDELVVGQVLDFRQVFQARAII
jgi:hypothetical protein